MTTRTIPQASYRTELPVDYRYGTVVTLADESQGLTCSVAVASEHFRGRAQNLQGFPSFEMAAQEVKSGRSEVLLVPATTRLLSDLPLSFRGSRDLEHPRGS